MNWCRSNGQDGSMRRKAAPAFKMANVELASAPSGSGNEVQVGRSEPRATQGLKGNITIVTYREHSLYFHDEPYMQFAMIRKHLIAMVPDVYQNISFQACAHAKWLLKIL